MATTDAAAKNLIVTMVGDYNGIVADNIDAIWDSNAAYAPWPDLQSAFAYRDAIRMLIGAVWVQVTQTTDSGVQAMLSDRARALNNRLLDATNDMHALMKQIGASGVPASGALTTVTPTTPPPGSPDANDPRYSGSPYYPVAPRWP